MAGDQNAKLLSLIAEAARDEWEHLDLSVSTLGFHIGASHLPILLAHLDELETVQRLYCRDSSIGPNGIGALVALAAALEGLVELGVEGCALGSVELAALGHGLSALKDLEYLDVSGNAMGVDGIRILTDGLPNAPSLSVLNLAGNKLGDQGVEVLAHIAPSLRHLRVLMLMGNDITAVGMERLAAAAVAHWPQLQCLNLCDNLLGDCGALVLANGGAMTELRTLLLRKNNIGSKGASALVRGQPHWPMLRWLDLGDNNINDGGGRPLIFGTLVEPWRSSLECFSLEHNPITSVPEEIMCSNSAAVWRSYAEKLLRGTAPLRAIKIVILGEGGAGKTHLRRRVFGRDDPAYHNPGELQTHDWETEEWPNTVPIGDKEYPLTIKVWDFGGQSHLHSSHRLFLSDRRSLFIIVCDATKTRAENRIDYWLRYVRHEASADCPVIVAVTKCDLHDDQGSAAVSRRLEPLDCAELRRVAGIASGACLSIVDGLGWCGVSPEGDSEQWRRHGRALKMMRKTVLQLIPTVPGLATQYPPSVVKVIDWLRKEAFGNASTQPVGWITFGRYLEACRELSVPDNLAETTLTVAESIGIVHRSMAARQREGDERLIFDPEWVRVPLYRIIRSGDGSRGGGILTWPQIESILPEHAASPGGCSLWERLPFSASDRVRLVDLMRDCGLIFELRRKCTTPLYFVPDHLPLRGVLGAPPGDYTWRRQFEWLPETVFLQLLGRLRQQVIDDPAAIWRDEITIAVGKHARMTVRHVAVDWGNDAHSTRHAVSSVFVAFVRCTESEAIRLLGLVDANLRSVLGEDAVSASEWEPYGRKAKASETGDAIPDYATYAVLVYDAVKEAEARGACDIRSWSDLVAWAAEIVRVRSEADEPDADLADAVREARADIERFARYCREARRRAWWSNRGKRKPFGK